MKINFNDLDELSKKIYQKQIELQPELKDKYSSVEKEKCLRDIIYTLTYLNEALNMETPSLFVNYIVWLKELLASYDISTNEISKNLSAMKEIFKEEKEQQEYMFIEDYLAQAIEEMGKENKSNSSLITEDSPLSALANKYLDFILSYKREKAVELLVTAAEKYQIKDIYLNVLQPVQREIGRLWQKNKVSVAQVHYCSSVTQLVMARLYPFILTGEKNGYKAVITCVGKELHEIGTRMVADLLELNGWDTIYLGANTPEDSIIKIVRDSGAHLLGISASISLHVKKVHQLIQKTRNLDIKIIVGGYAFNQNPELHKKIEADGFAADAEEAVILANNLIKVDR